MPPPRRLQPPMPLQSSTVYNQQRTSRFPGRVATGLLGTCFRGSPPFACGPLWTSRVNTSPLGETPLAVCLACVMSCPRSLDIRGGMPRRCYSCSVMRTSDASTRSTPASWARRRASWPCEIISLACASAKGRTPPSPRGINIHVWAIMYNCTSTCSTDRYALRDRYRPLRPLRLSGPLRGRLWRPGPPPPLRFLFFVCPPARPLGTAGPPT